MRHHAGGSNTSFTLEPLGRTAPAGGSWRERLPVPSIEGMSPSPIAAFVASRGRPSLQIGDAHRAGRRGGALGRQRTNGRLAAGLPEKFDGLLGRIRVAPHLREGYLVRAFGGDPEVAQAHLANTTERRSGHESSRARQSRLVQDDGNRQARALGGHEAHERGGEPVGASSCRSRGPPSARSRSCPRPGNPGSHASTPVPSPSVTATIISATVRATLGGTASRRTCGTPSRTTAPVPSVTRLRSTGSSKRPPLAIADHRHRHLHRGHADALAEGRVRRLDLDPGSLRARAARRPPRLATASPSAPRSRTA